MILDLGAMAIATAVYLGLPLLTWLRITSLASHRVFSKEESLRRMIIMIAILAGIWSPILAESIHLIVSPADLLPGIFRWFLRSDYVLVAVGNSWGFLVVIAGLRQRTVFPTVWDRNGIALRDALLVAVGSLALFSLFVFFGVSVSTSGLSSGQGDSTSVIAYFFLPLWVSLLGPLVFCTAWIVRRIYTR
jgi:hypothetical protein